MTIGDLSSPSVVVYGIPNCDTVRRARRWLKAHGIAVEFRDLRAAPIQAAQLQAWLQHLPYDSLLNRRGQAWRGLAPAQRLGIVDQLTAAEAMLANPLLIRRPILEWQDRLVVGFSESLYEGLGLGSPNGPPTQSS